MDEREAFEHLVDRYRPVRARHLLGALRVLALYGEDEVRRRGLIGPETLKAIRRDLHLAGVPWSSPGADQQATQAGE